ncbi:MAG: hypothetical protein ACOX6P_11230 [Candidatus Merdivicinus sp.]|jgi:hypothetical protein
MTFRENVSAILHYQPFEKMPVVSFGYWRETADKWAAEGHITQEEADNYRKHGDNGDGDRAIMKKLGFDFNWSSCIGASSDLFPHFESKILETNQTAARLSEMETD